MMISAFFGILLLHCNFQELDKQFSSGYNLLLYHHSPRRISFWYWSVTCPNVLLLYCTDQELDKYFPSYYNVLRHQHAPSRISFFLKISAIHGILLLEFIVLPRASQTILKLFLDVTMLLCENLFLEDQYLFVVLISFIIKSLINNSQVVITCCNINMLIAW